VGLLRVRDLLLQVRGCAKILPPPFLTDGGFSNDKKGGVRCEGEEERGNKTRTTPYTHLRRKGNDSHSDEIT
jgi:hypothetical protein